MTDCDQEATVRIQSSTPGGGSQRVGTDNPPATAHPEK